MKKNNNKLNFIIILMGNISNQITTNLPQHATKQALETIFPLFIITFHDTHARYANVNEIKILHRDYQIFSRVTNCRWKVTLQCGYIRYTELNDNFMQNNRQIFYKFATGCHYYEQPNSMYFDATLIKLTEFIGAYRICKNNCCQIPNTSYYKNHDCMMSMYSDNFKQIVNHCAHKYYITETSVLGGNTLLIFLVSKTDNLKMCSFEQNDTIKNINVSDCFVKLLDNPPSYDSLY